MSNRKRKQMVGIMHDTGMAVFRMPNGNLVASKTVCAELRYPSASHTGKVRKELKAHDVTR